MHPHRSRADARRDVDRAPFGVTRAGEPVDVVTLANAQGVAVRFITFGGTILSIDVPDRHGAFADVTLGYDTLEPYVDDRFYFGALVGRYANRIAGGRLTLGGREIRLGRNDGENHLHGGWRGFSRVVWNVEPFVSETSAGAVLTYTSPAGDEGYPGTLHVRVTYTLTDDGALIVDYRATTDADTPVNLTQHAYFNLAGHDHGDVLGHELTIAASRVTAVAADLIPTGALRSVADTPFDFRSPHRIGARIDDDDDQLRLARGYDHNFVLDAPSLDAPSADGVPSFAARLYDPQSGRVLDVHTTEPGIQLYSGNDLHPGVIGKDGRAYRRYGGVALETQHFPDSPNHPHFPSTILEAGAAYASRTIYRFGVA